MSDKGLAIKPFKCEHCSQRLAYRKGDTLIAYGFWVDLRESRNIWCDNCNRPTRFLIAKKRQSVLSLPQ
jgi:hypothetical protein